MSDTSVPRVTAWSPLGIGRTSVIGEVDRYAMGIPLMSKLILDEVSGMSWGDPRPGPWSRTHAWGFRRSMSRVVGTRDVHMAECLGCGMRGIVVDRSMRRRLSPSSMRARSYALAAQAAAHLESVADCPTARVMSVLES